MAKHLRLLLALLLVALASGQSKASATEDCAARRAWQAPISTSSMLQSQASHSFVVLTHAQLDAAAKEEGEEVEASKASKASDNGTASGNSSEKQIPGDTESSPTASVWQVACLVTGCVAFLSMVACIRRRVEGSCEARGKGDLGGLPTTTADGKCGPAVGPQHGPPIPAAKAEGGLLPLLEQNAQRQPDAPALVDAEGGEVVSYADLLKQSRALASRLRNAHLGDGDVVGLLLEPSRHFVVATLACMQAGAAWLPLDLKSPGPRLRHLLDRAGARLALAADGFSPAIVAPMPIWVIGSSGEVEAAGAEPPPPRPPLPHVERASGTAAIFYTSGSTGEPKAVRYGPDTLCHGALCTARLCEADSQDVFLVKTPVVWAVTEYEVFTPLVVGAKAVVDARAQRDVVRLAQTISSYDVSILVTSAPVLQLLADERLPSLRHAVNVGAALPVEVCALLQRSFGVALSVHNLYGCTETPCIQWTYDPSLPSRAGALALAGLPQPGVEVQLLDGDLHPVPEGALGEIYIGGPFLSQGYLGDERLTQERFAAIAPGGRFYKTGDTGRWLREANFRLALQVEGRVDRQLNIKGVRVAPEEVEAVLSQAPGVREAALVVIGEPGAERMVASVAGTGKDEEGLREAVRAHGSEHLPPHMRPAVVLVLSSLPKLGNGKVDLVSLRRRAAEVVPPPEEDAVSAVDSLGQMKTVKRQALVENRAMSVMRAVAAFQILLYHWYWCFFAGFSSYRIVSPEMWEKQGHPLLQAAITGSVGISMWSMTLFVTLQAYVDSREAPTSMAQNNLLAIVLYVVAYWPLPDILQYILHGPLHNDGFRISFENGSHRWYMLYYIACNYLHLLVFLPLRNWLKGAPTCSVVLVRAGLPVCVGLCIFLINGQYWVAFKPPFNVCRGVTSESTLSVLRFFVVDAEPNYCALLRFWHLHMFTLYTAAWWLGPPLVDYLRKARWAAAVFRMGPLPWFVLLSAAMVGYGAVIPGCEDEPRCAWLVSLTDPFCGYLVIITLALACQCRWFPTSFLSWLGNFSLAVYIVHVYFAVSWHEGKDWGMQYFSYNNTAIVPTPQDAVAAVGSWPGSSFAKLAVLLAYPVIFSATVGVAFQKVILLGIVSCQQAVKLLAGR